MELKLIIDQCEADKQKRYKEQSVKELQGRGLSEENYYSKLKVYLDDPDQIKVEAGSFFLDEEDNPTVSLSLLGSWPSEDGKGKKLEPYEMDNTRISLDIAGAKAMRDILNFFIDNYPVKNPKL